VDPIELPWPYQGIVEGTARRDQPPLTTPAAQNVRTLDPRTGRAGGGQRAGLSKFVEDQVATSGPVQAVGTVTFDKALTTYSVRTSPTVDWGRRPGGTGGGLVVSLAVTPSGDIYAASRPGLIEKYNPGGTLVSSTTVPLSRENERIRQIRLDEQGNLYVVTGAGSPTLGGSIFRYEPSGDGLDQLWSVDLEGEGVSCRARLGRLAVAVNVSDVEAVVRYYSNLQGTTPIVEWETLVPAPVAQVDMSPSGEVFVSSEPNDTRDDPPVDAGTFCGVKTLDWNPLDISDVDVVLRAWHRSTGIASSNGARVNLWPDDSGQNNAISPDFDTEAPRFNANSLCELPGVEFRDADRTRVASSLLPTGNLSPFNETDGRDALTFVALARMRPLTADTGQWLIHHGGDEDYGLVQAPESYWLQQFPGSSGLGDRNAIGVLIRNANLADVPTDALTNHTPFGRTEIVRSWDLNEQRVVLITLCIAPRATAGDETSFLRINGETRATWTTIDGMVDTQYTMAVGGSSVLDSFFASFDLLEAVWLQGAGADEAPDPGSSDDPKTVSNHDGAGSAIAVWEEVEGYLAHKFGVQDAVLATGHEYESAPPTGSAGEPTEPTGDILKFDSPFGVVAKLSASNGSVIWAETGSGVGYSVVVTDDGDAIYTSGPSEATGTADFPVDPTSVTFRKIIDQGTTYSEATVDGAWTTTDAAPFSTEIQLAVDDQDNLYVPVYEGATATTTIRKFDSSGTEQWDYTITTGASNLVGLCVAVDPNAVPDTTIDDPEAIYVGCGFGTGGTGNLLFRLALVDTVSEQGEVRSHHYIAVANGDVKRLRPDLTAGNQVEAITGGAGVIQSESRIVQMVQANGRMWIIDGANQFYYDPATGEVKPWAAESAGEMPRRPRLLQFWRQRALLGRPEEDPSKLLASKATDFFNWDQAPADLTQLDAWELDLPGDLNAIIPISDDLLILGLENETWRLTGDPVSGGQLHRFASHGIAFGKAWARDDSGRVFVHDTFGKIHALNASGSEPITDGRIDRRLEAINLDRFTLSMEFSRRDRGVHVFTVPINLADIDSEPDPDPDPCSNLLTTADSLTFGGSLTYVTSPDPPDCGDGVTGTATYTLTTTSAFTNIPLPVFDVDSAMSTWISTYGMPDIAWQGSLQLRSTNSSGVDFTLTYDGCVIFGYTGAGRFLISRTQGTNWERPWALCWYDGAVLSADIQATPLDLAGMLDVFGDTHGWYLVEPDSAVGGASLPTAGLKGLHNLSKCSPTSTFSGQFVPQSGFCNVGTTLATTVTLGVTP